MDRYYMPLKLHRVSGVVGYVRPTQELPGRVTLESPAIMTMTDLRQVTALTVEPHVSIEWALERMRGGGVRLLLVTNQDGDVVGLITSHDIQGNKPLQLLRETRVRRAEIRVRDIMTPKSELDCIDLAEVMVASVGHVLETLRRVGRHHALVCECDHNSGVSSIRGIFSANRLSQQLGITFEPIEVASTFAEMESALTAG
jgi:CBS domain containing-hemolysin-like protein